MITVWQFKVTADECFMSSSYKLSITVRQFKVTADECFMSNSYKLSITNAFLNSLHYNTRYQSTAVAGCTVDDKATSRN